MRGPLAFSGHPHCYCSSMPDSTCDFCRGSRQWNEEKIDTFTLAEVYKDQTCTALIKWLMLLRENGGTERMRNRISAMLAMTSMLPPFETKAMKYTGLFPTFGKD